jgi:hypothetical protein
VTRLRIPGGFDEDVRAGDYEVVYVLPTAGVLQIAPSTISVGQKEKPQWDSLQRHPGVQIECGHCREWFGVQGVALDEVRGWRCPPCGDSRNARQA